MQRIGIFGIGAIGSVLTKYLIHNNENELFFYNRTKHQSITINYNQTEERIIINFIEDTAPDLDWLIICLKEYHVKDAMNDILKLIRENTKLVIFQNGINTSDRYKKSVNDVDILETIIDCSVERITTSAFQQLRPPIITLPTTEIACEFMRLFISDEIDIKQTHSFEKLQWIKLIESSSIGSIQSLTGRPCSIFKVDRYLDDYKLLIDEGIEVAISESIDVGKDVAIQLMQKLKTYPASKGSSMLTDRLNGSMLELDAKIGAIIKIAQRNNVRVPVSQRYYETLLDYNRYVTLHK